MASIRKIKTKWLAEVRLKGLSTSKTFLTKIEAQSWAIQQEQQHGKHGGLVRGKTLGDALERYSLDFSPKKKGARWELLRIKCLRQHEISDILLTNLRREDIEKWMLARSAQVSNATINRELSIIQSTLRECRTVWKYMTENPF